MCGITAVYGDSALLKSLFMTVKQLERGTQGCGIAYTCNKKIKILKEPISPIEFWKKHYNALDDNVKIAIAHNRMPSVGKVCYENTHPFMSCDGEFALVHNGTAMINSLKTKLLEKGHRIHGDTDSEVIAHLLEDSLDERGDMIEALKDVMKKYLSGVIAVLTRDGKVYVARRGWFTVYYTHVRGEIYVASSLKAVLSLLDVVKERKDGISALNDGEVMEIENGKLKVMKLIDVQSEQCEELEFIFDYDYLTYLTRFI